MFQRAKTFVRNHWKKAVIGGIAVQVAAYGVRYASEKFLCYQEEQAVQYWHKVKKQQYFENVDQNCITTFRQLFQVMKSKIGEVLNAEDIQEQLKSNQVQNKLKAWDELKVIAFTRVLVTIYGSSILYVFLRIQLSMVGGYLIKGTGSSDNNGSSSFESSHSSSRGAASNSNSHHSSSRIMDEEAQRKYLDLSHYFVSYGVVKICEYVQAKVKSVIDSVSLKQAISAGDLEQLFWTIIRKADNVQENEDHDNDVGSSNGNTAAQATAPQLIDNPTKSPWKYVFPPEVVLNPEFFNGNVDADPIETSTLYRKLVCETFDLLESDDTRDILRFFESQGVSYFIDRISDSMNDHVSTSIASTSTTSTAEDTTPTFNEPRVAVAKLIPTMTSLHLIDVLDDPWIHLLTSADNVRIMSANIYEAFCVE